MLPIVLNYAPRVQKPSCDTAVLDAAVSSGLLFSFLCEELRFVRAAPRCPNRSRATGGSLRACRMTPFSSPWTCRAVISVELNRRGLLNPRNEVARPDPYARKTTNLRRMERNTLDLRGMTLSEAQDDCDMFFSNAIMDDLDGVYLLHGHGTGVLKAGLRRVSFDGHNNVRGERTAIDLSLLAGGTLLSVNSSRAAVASQTSTRLECR